MVAEVGATGQVLEISFAKSLQSSHRVAANRQAATSYPNQEVHLLQVCFSVSYELLNLYVNPSMGIMCWVMFLVSRGSAVKGNCRY